MREGLGALGFLLVTAAAAGIGALASRDAPAFYATLALPGWAPPAALFGPVWTLLYALMALAAWLVWRRHGFAAARMPLGLWMGQLFLNALWSWIFFRWRQGGWAVVEIVALDAALVATVIAFWRVRPLAALLLLPYLAWVAYATALAMAIWRKNPGLL